MHQKSAVTKLQKATNLLKLCWTTLKVAIPFLPSIWLPIIVEYYGVACGLVDGSGSLTARGLGITIIIHAGALIVLIASERRAKTDADHIAEMKLQCSTLRDTSDYYERIVASINACNVSKSNLLLESVRQYRNGGEMPYASWVTPLQQLRNVEAELQRCFQDLTNVPRDNIVVSMAYQVGDADWEWVDAGVLYDGLPLSRLVTDPATAFHRLLHASSPTLSVVDKMSSSAKQEYVMDGRDAKAGGEGSLLCWKIELNIPDGDDIVQIGRMVVSIASYGQRFFDGDDIPDNVASSISSIYRVFEHQIITELICLYLAERRDDKKTASDSFNAEISNQFSSIGGKLSSFLKLKP